MDTLTPARTRHHMKIRLATSQATEFIDLTDRLDQFVADAEVQVGIINVQTSHTTTAIVVNEHEPLLLSDFQAFLERTVPGSTVYGHDDMSRRIGVAPGNRPTGTPTAGLCCCRHRRVSTSLTAASRSAGGSACSWWSSTAPECGK